jgi:hypothetical protein
MQNTQINTQEVEMGRKWAAHLDAKRKSAEAQKEYSKKQQSEATTVFEAVRVSYIRSKVYLNYREKFYAVKVNHPTKADAMSKDVAKVEKLLAEVGAEKVVSKQGIIYRVAKR